MKEEITRIGVGRFSGLWANLPGYDLVERFIDVFATRQRMRLVITSDDFCELRILWGAVEFTKGAKKEFLIEGGPGFCEATLKSLEGSKRTVKVVERSLGR
jgi:hypothetical protein